MLTKSPNPTQLVYNYQPHKKQLLKIHKIKSFSLFIQYILKNKNRWNFSTSENCFKLKRLKHLSKNITARIFLYNNNIYYHNIIVKNFTKNMILNSPRLSAVAVISWSINWPQTASMTVKLWSSSYDCRCTFSLTCLAEGNSEPSIAFLGFHTPAGS